MNWVQENKSLAGILGVMIAGILGLGAWLYLSYAGYAESMDKWKQNDSSISTLKSKKVYPNKENAEAREAEVGDYGNKVDLLRSALLSEKVQQPIKPMSQTEFQAKLKERATAIVQMAKAADITLPADFALGFSDYTNNVPRSAEVAAELGVHLDVMERLVTTLIQSGVKSVEFFERSKLPHEDRPVEPKKPVVVDKKPKKEPKGKKGAKRQTLTEEQAAEPVLDRYPVKVIVTTDQTPFQNIINTLCDPVKMPHFLVVRLVRVENERQDGPSRDEIARKKSPEVSLEQPTDPAAPSGGAAAAPKVAPDAVTIIGEEKLKVYLEVDYVRFRAPISAEATETTSSTAATIVNP
ncbi:MAG TPA: Amuc_1100 family pilus-like protein [Candidatus Saccharimonadia bacterium]|nr:Amuc_1100 family pilus-like protein [Candidatus Saccharimonadia bacterium]